MGQSKQDVRPVEDSEPAVVGGRADRRLAVRLLLALVIACVAAVPIAVLAIVVKHTSGPVGRLDLAVTDGLHRFAAGNRWLVTALDWISTVGAPTTFRLAATVAALWLLAVARPRLAVWALVTTWGSALLGVLLKVLVERARPVLPHAVAHADGYSFPSGHALGAFVGCAVLLLLWLDLAAPRRHWIGWTVAAVVVATVCFSRVGLGVHYLSDVVGGCLVGLGWTAATTIAFQVWRVEAGLGRVPVAASGIEPEGAEPDVDPRPLPPMSGAFTEIRRQLPRVVLPWAALVAATVALGELITRILAHDAIGTADNSVSTWFAGHRTPLLNTLTALGTQLGETTTIVIVTFASYLGFRLIYRRWLESTALLLAVVGEVTGFVLVTLLVNRSRPAVAHLDAAPPTSSFPSGHTAASLCCYGMIAVLVARRAGGRVRWFLAAAVAVGALVALCRLYRGMHHLTDVLASAAYAGIWLTIVLVLVLRRAERTTS